MTLNPTPFHPAFYDGGVLERVANVYSDASHWFYEKLCLGNTLFALNVKRALLNLRLFADEYAWWQEVSL